MEWQQLSVVNDVSLNRCSCFFVAAMVVSFEGYSIVFFFFFSVPIIHCKLR